MRLTTLTFIGSLGIGVLGLAATQAPASAAPLVPGPVAGDSSNIVPVWGGCGWGFRPVPGHWSRWRGGWVPPQCVPNHGPYAGWRPYGYGYGYRYW